VASDAIVVACRQAAVDLGIRVTAPFVLTAPEGRSYSYAARFPDFGGLDARDVADSPEGLLLFDSDPLRPEIGPQEELCKIGDDAGYCTLGVSGREFVPYRRATYASCLRHFNWLGAPGARPAWYSIDPAELPS
jgi:hypothetical protein